MNLGAKLAALPIGVVSEEAFVDHSLGLTDRRGAHYEGAAIEIANNSYRIMRPSKIGPLTISGSTTELNRARGTLEPGAVVLGAVVPRPPDHSQGGSAVKRSDSFSGWTRRVPRAAPVPFGSSGMQPVNWRTWP